MRAAAGPVYLEETRHAGRPQTGATLYAGVTSVACPSSRERLLRAASPSSSESWALVGCAPSPAAVAAALESLAAGQGEAADGEAVLGFLLALPEPKDVADYLWDWLGRPADAVARDVCRLRVGDGHR